MKIKNRDKEYYTEQHLTYSCQYHVVFCTKYRRKVIDDDIKGRLVEVLESTSKEYEFQILDMEISPDCVHLILDCNPRFGIMNCVTKLKGNSSRILRDEFPQLKSRIPTLWTRNAFISTVGDLSLENINQYIEDQKSV